LDRGADPNAKNEFGETPLHVVAQKGSAPIAEVLIRRGAKIEAKDEAGNTPLILASGRQFDYMNSEVAKLLVSKGANPNAKNYNGETPLHVVYKEDIASALLKAGANPNTKSVGGSTPLHVIGKPSVAELLIAAGANGNGVRNLRCNVMESQSRNKTNDCPGNARRYSHNINVGYWLLICQPIYAARHLHQFTSVTKFVKGARVDACLNCFSSPDDPAFLSYQTFRIFFCGSG
jgi:hypothetical protein